MGTFPLSVVPISAQGIQAHCAWAPEPVFTLEESARMLGVERSAIKFVRIRHPEVKLPWEVGSSLLPTFGPSLTEYGEISVMLQTPGGPQEHACLTHHGLFRHAIYIRTETARRFCLAYPSFLARISKGELRPPTPIAMLYRSILETPKGHRFSMARQLAQTTGRCAATLCQHVRNIRAGKLIPEKLPIRKIKARLLFPRQVMALRESFGDSRDMFAARVGVRVRAVYRWEAGSGGMLAATRDRLFSLCPTDELRRLFE